jgi:hypothetical protein
LARSFHSEHTCRLHRLHRRHGPRSCPPSQTTICHTTPPPRCRSISHKRTQTSADMRRTTALHDCTMRARVRQRPCRTISPGWFDCVPDAADWPHVRRPKPAEPRLGPRSELRRERLCLPQPEITPTRLPSNPRRRAEIIATTIGAPPHYLSVSLTSRVPTTVPETDRIERIVGQIQKQTRNWNERTHVAVRGRRKDSALGTTRRCSRAGSSESEQHVS